MFYLWRLDKIMERIINLAYQVYFVVSIIIWFGGWLTVGAQNRPYDGVGFDYIYYHTVYYIFLLPFGYTFEYDGAYAVPSYVFPIFFWTFWLIALIRFATERKRFWE